MAKKENEKLYDFLEQKKAKINDIVEDSRESREYAWYKLERNLGQTKFLPKNFKLKTDCFIWENKVSLISYPTRKPATGREVGRIFH